MCVYICVCLNADSPYPLNRKVPSTGAGERQKLSAKKLLPLEMQTIHLRVPGKAGAITVGHVDQGPVVKDRVRAGICAEHSGQTVVLTGAHP